MVHTLRACRHRLDCCMGTKSKMHVMALQKHTASNLQAHQPQAHQLDKRKTMPSNNVLSLYTSHKGPAAVLSLSAVTVADADQ